MCVRNTFSDIRPSNERGSNNHASIHEITKIPGIILSIIVYRDFGRI